MASNNKYVSQLGSVEFNLLNNNELINGINYNNCIIIIINALPVTIGVIHCPVSHSDLNS